MFKNPAAHYHCRTSVLAMQLARATLGFPDRKQLTSTRENNFLLHLTDFSNDSEPVWFAHLEICCTSALQLQPQLFYPHFVFLGVFINSTLQQPCKNMYYFKYKNPKTNILRKISSWPHQANQLLKMGLYRSNISFCLYLASTN